MTLESKRPPNLEELVERIERGELTRKQAATEAGLNYDTFKGWLRRTGALARLKHTRGNTGINHRNALAKADPDKAKAYQDAVADVLAGGQRSARSLWEAKYRARGLSYVYLCELVKKARMARANEETARRLEASLQGTQNVVTEDV